MDVHIFILSTMTRRGTAAVLKNAEIYMDSTSNDILRFDLPQKKCRAKKLTVWCACQDPLLNEVVKNTLPYMDACICLYHDHDALSCMRVRNAMKLLESANNAIWLMSTSIPVVFRKHKSRVCKFYNQNGFERPFIRECTKENLEYFLDIDVKMLKHY